MGQILCLGRYFLRFSFQSILPLDLKEKRTRRDYNLKLTIELSNIIHMMLVLQKYKIQGLWSHEGFHQCLESHQSMVRYNRVMLPVG